MKKPRVQIGERIGSIVVIAKLPSRKPGTVWWRLRCDCGVEFEWWQPRGRQSCTACSNKRGAQLRARHGGAAEPLYAVYSGIKSRCRNPRQRGYAWYGARGVDLCPEWNDYSQFRAWALTAGWQPGLSVDRIDETKDYSPENCAIVTKSENVKRMRRKYKIVPREPFPTDALMFGAEIA